jgi:glyoxylase-like metal-dependent hydrolase (beta-lactamase superfamily II)
MQVLHRNGVYLPESDLWLDPHHVQNFAVVSHAHADHMKGHAHILATAPTIAMMQLRGARRSRFQQVHFGEPVEVGEARVTLFPAGHVLGSAQVLVEQHDGQRLLYSGDFKLRAGLSAEAIEVPTADVLVMETTFGLPRYSFPDREEVMDDILAFCRSTLAAGCAPVLFCYSLGKGQEVLAGLDGAEFPIYLQAQHFEMAQLYRRFGVALPPFQLYQPGQTLDGVLLCAAGCRRYAWFEKLDAIRTAYISGWALDRGARWRFKTDAAFPLSDHAVYEDLIEYVHRSGARTVYTMHGFDAAFATDLCALGFDAAPLPRSSAQGRLELFAANR